MDGELVRMATLVGAPFFPSARPGEAFAQERRRRRAESDVLHLAAVIATPCLAFFVSQCVHTHEMVASLPLS